MARISGLCQWFLGVAFFLFCDPLFLVNLRWKIGIFLGVLFLSVLASLYWAENRVGKQTFEEVISRAHAAGMSFGNSGRLTEEISPDDNFFHTPLFEPLLGATAKWEQSFSTEYDFGGRLRGSRLRKFSLGRLHEHPDFPGINLIAAGYSEGRTHDFELWAALLRRKFPKYDEKETAEEFVFSVLEGEFKSEFAELENASKRKYSVPEMVEVVGSPFEIDEACPAFEVLNEVALVLNFRIAAALKSGDARVALDTVQILSSLAEGVESTNLVGNSSIMDLMVDQMIESLWIGFLNESWSKEDLEELLVLLSRIRFQKVCADEYASYFHTMRAFWSRFASDRKHVDLLWIYHPVNHVEAKRFATSVLPEGIIYRNGAVALSWILDEGWKPMNNGDFKGFSTMASRAPDLKKISTFYLENNLFPVEYYHLSFSRTWVAKLQIELACAIELFRITNQRYPETLEELAAQGFSVPIDPFSGDQMRYQRKGSRYLLYSVGWDCVDDGGAAERGNSGFNKWKRNDWVWEYSVSPRKSNLTREKDLNRLKWSNEEGKNLTEEEFSRMWMEHVLEMTLEPDHEMFEQLQHEKKVQSVRKKHLKRLNKSEASPEEIRRQEIIRAQQEKIRRQREGG